MRASTQTHPHQPARQQPSIHPHTHTHTHKHRFRNKMSPGIMYNNINIMVFNELPGDLSCIYYYIILYCINRGRWAERRPQKRNPPGVQNRVLQLFIMQIVTSKQWPLTISVWGNYCTIYTMTIHCCTTDGADAA